MSGAGGGLVALGFPTLILGAAATVVVAATGAGIGIPWLIVAGAVLAVGATIGAALAAVAFLRGDWRWGVGMLLVWPILVPLYLRVLARRRGSGEPEV